MTRHIILCALCVIGLILAFGVPSLAGAEGPEALMAVTLACDKDMKIAVLPPVSPGVDVVNMGGQSDDGEPHGSRLSFQALPGAVIYVALEPNETGEPGEAAKGKFESFLVLRPDDNGRMLRVRADRPVVYLNDVPAWIDLTGKDTPEATEPDDAARSRYVQEALKRLETLKNTPDAWKRLGVGIARHEAVLPILQTLKGTGVGIYIEGSSDESAMPDPGGQAFLKALAEVKPRQLMINSKDLARIEGELPSVETLYLEADEGQTFPDLSRLTGLKNLVVIGDKSVVDLKQVARLAPLQSLGLFMAKYRNADSLGQLSQLRYLSLAGDSEAGPLDPKVLARLPRLQYVVAELPEGADLSFAQRLPHLQTLGMPVSKQQDLRPLAKVASLRCLGVTGVRDGSDDDLLTLDNVRELRKARPDVKVVPYKGICLGSFWLLPLMVASGVAAWWIRRRRHTVGS